MSEATIRVIVKNKTKQQVILSFSQNQDQWSEFTPKDPDKKVPIPPLAVRIVEIPSNMFSILKEKYKDKLIIRPN